ncbi:MAG: maleylpyruvate isomerase family mycothiol-dependent enzyme [Acidimicrobiales bacterium]
MALDPDPYRALLDDLAGEHAALDALVAPLDVGRWQLPTPSPGWTVGDQIGHLHYFDGTAYLSVVDPAAFVIQREQLIAGFGDQEGVDDTTLAFARTVTPDELLGAWRLGRKAMLSAFAALAPKDRLEWYGPPMSAMSFVTARLMETWAHGQDVLDTVGGSRPATDRLRHVAHLGVRTEVSPMPSVAWSRRRVRYGWT